PLPYTTLCRSRGATARGTRGGRDGDRRRGGDLEGLLELLHELRELEQGHLLEGFEQFVGAELCHEWSFLVGWGAEPRYAAPSAGVWSCTAAARRATWDAGALNRPAALAKLPFVAPASLASSTSRDARSAIFSISATDSGRPSM